MIELVKNKNKNVASLKRGIIDLYITNITSQLNVLKSVLADKTWSNDGSDYHKECRLDTNNEILEIKRQIKVLSKNHGI